jgi:hypothetical protein
MQSKDLKILGIKTGFFVSAFAHLVFVLTIILASTTLSSKPEQRTYESVYDEQGSLVQRAVKINGIEHVALTPKVVKDMADEIFFLRERTALLERKADIDKRIIEQYESLSERRKQDLDLSRKEVRSCYATLDALTKAKQPEPAFYETNMFSYFLGNLTCFAAFTAWEHSRNP